MKLESVEDDLFRLAVESSPAAMIVTGQDGVIQFANAETSRMFGYQQQELVGQSIDTLVPTRLRPTHRSLRQGFLAESKQKTHGERPRPQGDPPRRQRIPGRNWPYTYQDAKGPARTWRSCSTSPLGGKRN